MRYFRLDRIHQVDSNRIAHLRPNDRSRHSSIKRPNQLLIALRYGHQLLLNRHLDRKQVTTIRCTSLNEGYPFTLATRWSARVADGIRRGVRVKFHDRKLIGR